MSLWFLLGVLNAKVADFVFRRIAKVKDGGFFEANRQFIAPLPIPNATPEQRADIAARATALQSAHSRRRDLLNLIAKRMDTLRKRAKPAEWLFPGMKTKREWAESAPAGLDPAECKSWAAQRMQEELEANETSVGERIAPGATMDAQFVEGELSFLINGVPVISRIFEEPAAGAFILAQWKVLATSLSISDSLTGKKLCDKLRRLAENDGSPAVNQIMAYQTELATLDAAISQQEADMNAAVYALYALTPEEIRLVERG